jgi:hypothetical protein
VQCVDGSPGGQPVGEQPAEVRVPGVDRLLVRPESRYVDEYSGTEAAYH